MIGKTPLSQGLYFVPLGEFSATMNACKSTIFHMKTLPPWELQILLKLCNPFCHQIDLSLHKGMNWCFKLVFILGVVDEVGMKD